MPANPRTQPENMIDENAPLLVFGGPYSNLQATRALKDEAERLGIPSGNVICTGDIVAYAANPEETARLIRDWEIAVVAGNCEEQLAGGAADCGCGFADGSECDRLSRGWYPYALAHTSAESRAWMAGLPQRLDVTYAGAAISVVHGGATQNNRFLFGSQHAELEAEWRAVNRSQACDIVLAGHAGIPFVASLSGGFWVNAGVIGMPANDGTPDGWYVLVDQVDGALRLRHRRLAYDFATAAAAMRRAGHANGYARTLVTGIWPSHDVLPAAERRATGQPLPQVCESLLLPAAA